MKIMAVICEYNPFHNGHAYQLARQKKELGCDAVLCLMSGHFVQRGEPAICDKWARAEMALRAGCDLVLELPVVYALQSAEGFAQGAVSLLASLGVEGCLAFGSESADIDSLMKIASLNKNEAFQASMRVCLSNGESYPVAFSRAAESVLSAEEAELLKNSNDMLGVEYIRAIKKTGARLVPSVVQRKQGQHDSMLAENEFLSATGIRNRIFCGEEYEFYMPESAYSIMQKVMREGCAPVSPESCLSLLCYAVMRADQESLAEISGVSEGLENRLKQAVGACRTWQELIQAVKSKRYPQSRINRVLMKTLLGITKQDEKLPPSYGRVLGIGENGRMLMRHLEDKTKVPLVTKVAHADFEHAQAKRMFELDVLATDIYTLLFPNQSVGKSGLDFYRSPIVLK